MNENLSTDHGPETERMVRASEFMSRLGIKKSKFYDAKKLGLIPPPANVTKTITAWHESVVRQTINAIAAGQLSL